MNAIVKRLLLNILKGRKTQNALPLQHSPSTLEMRALVEVRSNHVTAMVSSIRRPRMYIGREGILLDKLLARMLTYHERRRLR